MSGERPKFTIVGAGLSGTLMAVYLGRAGYDVELYEKRSDPRIGQADAGRSINLALSLRGIHALEEVACADAVLEHAIPMRGRMMHDVDGELSYQPYGTESSHFINSVSRTGLNVALLDACDKYDNISVKFGYRCTAVDLKTKHVHLTNGQGDSDTPYEMLIGADGAFSAVRAAMARGVQFNYSQDYLTHGYKELTIPAADNGAFQLEKNALHIWPRGGFMMIALPNADATYTCTLFWPYEGPHSFGALNSDDDVMAFFRQHFADAVDVMPGLVEDYRRNPVGSLLTVRCDPWHYRDSALLMGDAAHAVVPFYGQGMNASFEDCTVLNECIQQYAPDWSRVASEYSRLRKANCDALADMALHNFIEMRDHVASPVFLIKKKLGRALHRLLPNWYVPPYSLVTFSRMPYADVCQRVRRQNRTIAWVVTSLVTLLILCLLWLV